MDGSATPTLAEAIRVGLADEITAGKLRPGTELDEQAIAARFGASRTPMREALRALASAGLVSLRPRRGVRVAALTPSHLGDLFELMAETGAMCARLATYRMTPQERFAVQSLHRAALAAVEAQDVDAYDRLNRDFHPAIYHGTHNASRGGTGHARPYADGRRGARGLLRRHCAQIEIRRAIRASGLVGRRRCAIL